VSRPANKETVLRKPPWIRIRIQQGGHSLRVEDALRSGKLHTVCEEALCPNLGFCWKHGHATILILGEQCTRSCGFCNVKSGRPKPCDNEEPERVAEAVREIGLKHVVITSVTRDDLPDGGAEIWAETIRQIRKKLPNAVVEVLIPDFQGNWSALDVVLAAGPHILGHNLETVPSLYPEIRPAAEYKRSLELLQHAHEKGFIVKTGLMLGLGEKKCEVSSVLRDARSAGCDILYLGQYLRPSRDNAPVLKYVTPADFEAWKAKALKIGFPVVVSGPFVRSSYRSEEQERFLLKSISGLKCL
jgi:lipoyl synthase